MRTHTVDRLAAFVLGLEGLAVAALVGWQIWALAVGDTGSVQSAVALMVLTAVGAVAVLAFAVATWRGLSWGRSGGVVTQLLILAVALGAVTGAYASPTTGLALAIPGLIALVLLLFAV
ncbi:histidine kinase, partial [Microbacterium terregens]